MWTSPAIRLSTGKMLLYKFASGRFHTSNLCRTEVEFCWQKQQNRVLCHPFGDLAVTAQGSSVARWKAHCPLPISNNWTFSLAFTAEALLSESCWNQVFSCDKEPVHRPQLVFSCQGVQIEDVKEGITLDQWLLACVCVQKNCMRACVWVYWSDNARYMTRQKRSKFTRPRY